MGIRARHAWLLACLVCLVAVGSASARELGQRSLARGSHGHDVRTLQRALTALGYPTRPTDGIYGPRTARSVRAWQRARKLVRDGRMSRSEARRVRQELLSRRRGLRRGSGGATMQSPERQPIATEQPPDAALEAPVGPGTTGPVVQQAQADLARLGFPVMPADGVYGDGTAAAIRSYQAAFFARQTGSLSASSVARLHRRVGSIPPGPHTFPLQGSWTFSGKDGRYGDSRGDHVHAGQDLPAPGGTPLVAVTSGTVSTRAFQRGGAGNYVVLQGDDGVDYVYMHMRKPALAKPGQRVGQGELLGEVGATGQATGPHLHFELWTAHWFNRGHHFDPLPALLAWR
jgi:murein DD-endopeptidase MepM/ murein hydrolase activator NlpD